MTTMLTFDDDPTTPSYLKYELKNVMVSSYSLGGSSSGATAPGSINAGTADRGTLTVSRPISAKVSSFGKLATSGGRFKSMTLIDDAPQSGQDGACTYRLSGIKVVDTTKKADPLPTETITIAYEKVEWSYSRVPSKNVGVFKSATLDLR